MSFDVYLGAYLKLVAPETTFIAGFFSTETPVKGATEVAKAMKEPGQVYVKQSPEPLEDPTSQLKRKHPRLLPRLRRKRRPRRHQRRRQENLLKCSVPSDFELLHSI